MFNHDLRHEKEERVKIIRNFSQKLIYSQYTKDVHREINRRSYRTPVV